MLFDSLPNHLLERSRWVHGQPEELLAGTGACVMYWMRNAVRSEENPALDVARWLAAELDLPLLIYHAISEDYDYASDRHHTFMLEGARDVQSQFAEKGLSYSFFLSTEGDRRPHLVTLANSARVVVTEDMPVDPSRRFLRSLQRKTTTPMMAVDTACVVPMQMVKKPYTRAFQYRNATKRLYAERLTRRWPVLPLETQPLEVSQLAFDPIDLTQADLSQLVAKCDIDHSVGPIIDSMGGSQAGYERWQAFKSTRLKRYASQRNNALVAGVSRMSPYLHYGMVSPFRIAREAAAIDHGGAEKYLDELLIWRELAYAFCFYRDDHDQWTALPDWAQETLEQHQVDQRSEIYSWEQLARGETADEFWNTAQKSLLMQGELHNNVRMTWGKAVLKWKQSPREALQTLIDLNHRYALDGRDPASYGGILWCLGQFDRPFEPRQDIIGSVRPRPTAEHARRLDLEQFRAQVTTPKFRPVPRVAVIGAGISGLFAARTLQDHGWPVTVFEKSRGLGGRMATRRVDPTDGLRHPMSFDHGAQYFTARNHHFQRYVNSWVEQGHVALWPDTTQGADQKIVVIQNGEIQSESNSEVRYVGVPTMNAICKHLGDKLSIQTGTRVAKVLPEAGSIQLWDENNESLGNFDRLIVTAPAAQAAELLTPFPHLSSQISKIVMNPCWAAMVGFEHPLTDHWVGAFLHDSFLSWAARNGTKSGRHRPVEQLVIHASPQWTESHWEQDPEQVGRLMIDEFWRVSGIPARTPIHLRAHRWKFAIPESPVNQNCFYDSEAGIAACGDWVNGSRVEGAFMSGMAAAGRILSKSSLA